MSAVRSGWWLAAVAATAAVAAHSQTPPAESGQSAPKADTPGKSPTARSGKAMRFALEGLDLAPGDSYLVELVVPSPTGRAVTGTLAFEAAPGVTVQPDTRWKDRLPAWGAKTYPRIRCSPQSTGEILVRARFSAGGEALLPVRIATPTMDPIPAADRLTVKITNPFRSRPMTGRVQAANPDRFLGTITARPFRLGPGETGEVVFPLPGAAPAEGEEYLFTLTLQTYDGHKSQKTIPLKFPSR
ncbi:MAG: hypothetical protein FJX77_05105 [Armatimonadetes bacterium]|nr:hypothetical protein [Armatimonadota bacterium]